MLVFSGVIFFILFLIVFSIGEIVIDEKFFNSAREGDAKYVEAYLKANPTLVSARDGRGNNALVIAAGRGKIDVLKVLLKYRANPEDYTNSGLFEGKSALSWAASQGANILNSYQKE
jgi:ankyrin repeat protein